MKRVRSGDDDETLLSEIVGKKAKANVDENVGVDKDVSERLYVALSVCHCCWRGMADTEPGDNSWPCQIRRAANFREQSGKSKSGRGPPRTCEEDMSVQVTFVGNYDANGDGEQDLFFWVRATDAAFRRIDSWRDFKFSQSYVFSLFRWCEALENDDPTKSRIQCAPGEESEDTREEVDAHRAYSIRRETPDLLEMIHATDAKVTAAIRTNNAAVFQAWLDDGGAPTFQMLWSACSKDSVDVARAILDKIDLASGQAQKLFDRAISTGCNDVARLFLAHPDVRPTSATFMQIIKLDSLGSTILCTLLEDGRVDPSANENALLSYCLRNYSLRCQVYNIRKLLSDSRVQTALTREQFEQSLELRLFRLTDRSYFSNFCSLNEILIACAKSVHCINQRHLEFKRAPSQWSRGANKKVLDEWVAELCPSPAHGHPYPRMTNSGETIIDAIRANPLHKSCSRSCRWNAIADILTTTKATTQSQSDDQV